MLHPIGRLPSLVYWRRRMLLAGIVFVLALSAVWFFSGGASGDPGASATDAALPSTAASTSGEQQLTGLEQIVPSLVPSAPADPFDPVASGVPAEGTVPVPATTAAVEPGFCPDEAIALSVGAEFGQYAAGSKPRLGLNVTNISAVACIRDLDLALQTYGLFATDGTRLWGSRDCYPDRSVPTPQLIQPGQVVAFSIIWSGKTSQPTCSMQRELLGPGNYILRGYLGNLVSPDIALVLT